MRDIRELRYFQSLPLEQKVEMTKQRIQGWYEYWNGNVYVGFSGGKDSTVLLRLVRELYPSVEAVFVDTGLEYSQIREFVKGFDNVTWVRPKMRFDEVIKQYGYPLISKNVSHSVRCARNKPDGNVVKKIFNPEKKGPYAMYKWNDLRFVDFRMDDRCCEVMKKQPSHEFAKKTGKQVITAEMAVESIIRTDNWRQHGCNAFDAAVPKSTPMIFWTENDVLQYIYENDIPICSVYGDVVKENEQQQISFESISGKAAEKFTTTGCQRTGCVFCGYGAHLEKEPTRFQQLKEFDRKKYDYCFNGGEFVDRIWKPNKDGLGMRYVLNRLNEIYGEGFIKFE